MSLSELGNSLLSLIYPNRCPVCSREIRSSEFFCEECAGALSEPPGRKSAVKPLSSLTAATTYDETSEKVIARLKDGVDRNTVNAAAFLIYEMLSQGNVFSEIDVITAIPSHKKDLARRGYNQSFLIAKRLSKLCGRPFAVLLKKKLLTAPQKSLFAAERMINLTGAFSALNTEMISGRRILLIDDVSTTGSTLRECASQLVVAGAESVHAAVFAKTKDLT